MQTLRFVPNLQASNFDPSAVSESGTCTYLYEDPETGSKQEGSLGQFVSSTIGSLFGNKGDKTGPNWEGSGYAYSGDIDSQRDIDRLVRICLEIKVICAYEMTANKHHKTAVCCLMLACNSSCTYAEQNRAGIIINYSRVAHEQVTVQNNYLCCCS